jgi:hypothetical protein
MFKDLIIRNSRPVTFKRAGTATFNKSIKVPGTPIEFTGKAAVFPMTARELQKYEAGSYTAEDKTVFVPDPLKVKRQGQTEEETLILKDGDQVVYKNLTYTLKSLSDFSDVSDFLKFAGKKEVIKSDQSGSTGAGNP